MSLNLPSNFPNFKPMRGVQAELDKLQFPLLVSPKIDGIRCLVINGRGMSRNLIQLPNVHLQGLLAGLPSGLDGEVVVGYEAAKDVYNRTNSAVMSKTGDHDFKFLVFDTFFPGSDMEFSHRNIRTANCVEDLGLSWVQHLKHELVENLDQLLMVEALYLEAGYEGMILRSPSGEYKQGKATLKSQGMLKLKRFTDSEAEILGTEELHRNDNVLGVDAFGNAKRSSHQENMIPMGTLGALCVRDVHYGWEFNVGGGFSDELRASLWADRDALLGKIVKYKYFPHGMKDVPRHPGFLGFRDKIDL